MGTRQSLLQAALAVFSERGMDGGSIREIARRAGVNVATIYHHFGSKRGLLMALFGELGYVDALKQWPPSSSVPEGAPPQAILEEILFETWTLMAAGEDFIRLSTVEGLKGDPDALSVAAEFREQGQRALEAALVHGRIANKSDAPGLARVIRQVVWGVFVEALMYGDLEPDSLRQRARGAAAVLLGKKPR
jgi:AcrR family transcriptional regulator